MPVLIRRTTIPVVDASADAYEVSYIVDIYPTFVAPELRVRNARLFADDVQIPFQSYTYQRTDADLAGTLDVTLSDPADRVAILRGASFRFEFVTGLGIDEVVEVLFNTAQLSRSDYHLANQGLSPADSFTLSVTPLIQSMLDATPYGNEVLYDPARLTIRAEDLMSTPSVDGVYVPVVVPIAGFSVHDLLDYVAEQCGFAGVTTTIPDEPLRRVDFSPGSTYWSAAAGRIGLFDPKPEVDADNYLVVRNGTLDVDSDTSSARELPVSYVKRVSMSSAIRRFRSTLLTYQEDSSNWDYSSLTHDVKTDPDMATVPDIFTTTDTWTRNYYRNGFPDSPVRTEIAKIVRETWAHIPGLRLVHRSVESYIYDDLGNLLTRDKTVMAEIPVAVSASTGVGATHYTLDGDGHITSATTDPATDFTIFERMMAPISREVETSIYLAHPYEYDQVYNAYKSNEVSGLVAVNSDEKQLGENYYQNFITALRSGNLYDLITMGWSEMTKDEEWMTPLPNRKVRVRSSHIDKLNPEVAGATKSPDNGADRVGDIGSSSLRRNTKLVHISEGGDPTAKLVDTLDGGEFTLATLEALAVRRNKRQFLPATVQMSLPDTDLSAKIGRLVDPKVDGRENVSLGTYMITGLTYTGTSRTHETQITARQVA